MYLRQKEITMHVFREGRCAAEGVRGDGTTRS